MESINSNPGNSFLISVGVIYEIVAAINSSPQTTEINADVRAATLMKWVNLGLLQAGVFTAIGAIIAKNTGYEAWPIVLGGTTAGGLIYIQYIYAKNSGIKNGGQPTETYSNGWNK